VDSRHAQSSGEDAEAGIDPPRSDIDAIDRAQLLDRLQSLRSILPVFAQDLAGARRQVATLRLENSRLLERVRALQREDGR